MLYPHVILILESPNHAIFLVDNNSVKRQWTISPLRIVCRYEGDLTVISIAVMSSMNAPSLLLHCCILYSHMHYLQTKHTHHQAILCIFLCASLYVKDYRWYHKSKNSKLILTQLIFELSQAIFFRCKPPQVQQDLFQVSRRYRLAVFTQGNLLPLSHSCFSYVPVNISSVPTLFLFWSNKYLLGEEWS